nr:hypothetical protein [uncultured Dongia sp.]
MHRLLGGLLLTFIGSGAFADDVIVGDPASCHLRIEYEPKEQMLHLRPAIPTGATCEITPVMVQAGLYQALDRQRHNANLGLIFLGRVADYHWLSDDLIERSRCSSAQSGWWDGEKGQAIEGSNNAFVADVLEDELGHCESKRRVPALDAFGAVLAEHGYDMTGVSAEKVLLRDVPGSDEWPFAGGKFPYDALVHLRIKKAP